MTTTTTTNTIKARKFVFKRMSDVQVHLIGTNAYGAQQVEIQEWSEKAEKYFHIIQFDIKEIPAFAKALKAAYEQAKTALDTSPEDWKLRHKAKTEQAKTAEDAEALLKRLQALGYTLTPPKAPEAPVAPKVPRKTTTKTVTKPLNPEDIPTVDDLEELTDTELSAISNVLAILTGKRGRKA